MDTLFSSLLDSDQLQVCRFCSDKNILQHSCRLLSKEGSIPAFFLVTNVPIFALQPWVFHSLVLVRATFAIEEGGLPAKDEALPCRPCQQYLRSRVAKNFTDGNIPTSQSTSLDSSKGWKDKYWSDFCLRTICARHPSP